MTQLQLTQLVGAALAATWYASLEAAMRKHGINTPQRQAHFLAQILHESGGLKSLEENLNYSAGRLVQVWPRRFDAASAAKYAGKPEAIANRVYGGRLGNGAESSGDGWRYRGRGLIQLTGRANYTAYSKAAGVDAVGNPHLLVAPTFAADAAGWFWAARGLNEIADTGDIQAVTRRVNGGYNGLEDRQQWLKRAVAALVERNEELRENQRYFANVRKLVFIAADGSSGAQIDAPYGVMQRDTGETLFIRLARENE